MKSGEHDTAESQLLTWIMQKEVIIFGATGAVGSELLRLCLDGNRYSRVHVIARRPTSLTHEKLQWTTAEFDALDNLELVSGLVDGDAYCCLGTTIKAAGSEEAFRRVDYAYVLNAARFAKKSSVTQFSLVTAIAANPESRILYNRTKGEVEAALIEEGFPTLNIFRPALLKGKRAEFRLKEEIGNWLMFLVTPLFHIGLQRYKPVEISTLARALYVSADRKNKTISPRIFESDEIQTY
jgi:uncharacterized protein YbjT (DUF2867 family)